IGLHDGAVPDGRIVLDAPDGPQLVYSAVTRAVRLVFEAYLANRAVLRLERGNDVSFAETQRDQPKLRVFWGQWFGFARVGHEKAARSTQRRLGMASEALIGIVPRAQPVGIGVELRKCRVELTQAGDRCALRH